MLARDAEGGGLAVLSEEAENASFNALVRTTPRHSDS
jgi:hypothetical protein